jgi:hypothetical protein
MLGKCVQTTEKHPMMGFDLMVFSPVIALISGVAILLVPRLLNYIVAFYLIFVGIIGLSARF